MLASHFKYSIQDFVKLYKESTEQIPNKTLESFISALKRIEKTYGEPLEKLKLIYVLKPNELKRLLVLKDYADNSIYATISAVGKIIGLIDAPLSVYNQIKTILKDLRDKRRNLATDNIKSVRESEQWIDFNKIYDKMNELYPEYNTGEVDKYNFRAYLMLCLFVYNPPVRIGNYLNCIVIKDEEPPDTNFNYLVINNSNYKFIFNKYKTSKVMGQQTLNIDNEKLINLLDLYFLEYYNNSAKFFLFKINNPKLEITQTLFTETLKNFTKKVFDRSFSIDIIRHSYINDFYQRMPSVKEKMALSTMMNHSNGTQALYFKK